MGNWTRKAFLTGHSIGGNPAKTRETNRYPLRKIVEILRASDNLFTKNRVRFECGHEGSCWGEFSGRCKECEPREELLCRLASGAAGGGSERT